MERTLVSENSSRNTLFWSKLGIWQFISAVVVLGIFFNANFNPRSYCMGDSVAATESTAICSIWLVVWVLSGGLFGIGRYAALELSIFNAVQASALAAALLDWTNELKVLLVIAYFVGFCLSFRPAQRECNGIKERTFYLSLAVQFSVVLLAMLLVH